MAHRLRKAGFQVEQQFPIDVFDEDGTKVGHFVADLLVQGQLIVELKACSELESAHVAQALGYLRASRFEHPLLVNFGPSRLEVKKLILSVERPMRLSRGSV